MLFVRYNATYYWEICYHLNVKFGEHLGKVKNKKTAVIKDHLQDHGVFLRILKF